MNKEFVSDARYEDGTRTLIEKCKKTGAYLIQASKDGKNAFFEVWGVRKDAGH